MYKIQDYLYTIHFFHYYNYIKHYLLLRVGKDLVQKILGPCTLTFWFRILASYQRKLGIDLTLNIDKNIIKNTNNIWMNS